MKIIRKRWYSIAVSCTLTLALFTGCTAAPGISGMTEAPKTTASPNSEAENETAASAGTMAEIETESSASVSKDSQAPDHAWINSNIFDNISPDTHVSAKDDFALYVNRDWALQAEVPNGYLEASDAMESSVEIEKKLIQLIQDETLVGKDAEIVRAVASESGNWEKRNQLGYAPLRPYLDRIQAIKTISDATNLLTEIQFLPSPVGFGVGTSLQDSSSYIVYIQEAVILQNDSAEYESPTEYGEKVLMRRKNLLLYMLKRLKYSQEEAEALITQCLSFEEKFASKLYTQEDSYQSDYLSRIENYYTAEELAALCGSFPILDILEKCGFPQQTEYIVTNPEFAASIPSFWTEENLEEIKSYLTLHLLLLYWDDVDRDTYDYLISLNSEFYGTDITQSEDQIVLQYVTSHANLPLQNLYLKYLTSEKRKQDTLDMIQQFFTAYKEILAEEEWLSEETKKEAMNKLDHIVKHAAYPDQPADTSFYDISQYENLIELEITLNEAFSDSVIARLGTKIDRTQWDWNDLALHDVNAFYSAEANSITILDGTLAGEVYREDWSFEKNLAGLGAATIGHEISHAFDDYGAQFDAYGNLSDWWTEEDYDAFQQRVDKLITYYDKLTPMGNEEHQNGTLISGEAIADMAGMKAALKVASTIEDFNYQDFFIQYAKSWKYCTSREAVYEKFINDEHPLPYLRVNVTLQQFDEFLEAFDIQPGDGMYLAPEDRVSVW